MNILIAGVLAKIKKVNFEKNGKKDPELTSNSIDKFTAIVSKEKTELLQTQSEESTKLILVNALLERAKELQVRKLTYKPLGRKDIYQDYLENIIGLHNSLATSLS